MINTYKKEFTVVKWSEIKELVEKFYNEYGISQCFAFICNSMKDKKIIHIQEFYHRTKGDNSFFIIGYLEANNIDFINFDE